MKVFSSILLILISLISNCEPKKIPFSETDTKLILEVFQESQKTFEGLLGNPPKLSIEGIQKSVATLETSDHPKIKDWKTRLTESIPKNPENIEVSYESLSNFSLILVEIKNQVSLPESYQQFYCPMVEKYWVSKDKEVRNPYAPEMRECGEIITDNP